MAIFSSSMDAYEMNFLTPSIFVRWLKQKKNLKLGGLIIILKDHIAFSVNDSIFFGHSKFRK